MSAVPEKRKAKRHDSSEDIDETVKSDTKENKNLDGEAGATKGIEAESKEEENASATSDKSNRSYHISASVDIEEESDSSFIYRAMFILVTVLAFVTRLYKIEIPPWIW